ncbi:PepSY-associated TM helix domain-containing protein [Croceicoccus sp. YJ47]|uniref:PepSY-associated TM helix domain-containing protein n=1 Tax=Croceicoccus sp. YJ47 TaxID=2798724 RepID=UPI001921FDC9|nr:PepSY-associated TM helix domain-containing protein [Croceicoccus sp. YJ47]QQN73392.1 PepSY-associated TM helix domain-containing protein [Croceicoccus sp. YJ47]
MTSTNQSVRSPRAYPATGGAGGAAATRAPSPAPPRRAAARARRVSPFWSKQLHLWHWVSSAICLVGLLLFAFTGITLNHAADISADPVVVTVEDTLQPSLLRALQAAQRGDDPQMPTSVAQWSRETLDTGLAGRPAEWSEQEVYVPLPRPGGDGWVAFDLQTGDVIMERTDRGWISYLNDLHKARDTGTAWGWFIDIFSIACFVFALSGLFLLWLHAKKRRSTWPLVGAGLVVPALLIIIFIQH